MPADQSLRCREGAVEPGMMATTSLHESEPSELILPRSSLYPGPKVTVQDASCGSSYPMGPSNQAGPRWRNCPVPRSNAHFKTRQQQLRWLKDAVALR